VGSGGSVGAIVGNGASVGGAVVGSGASVGGGIGVGMTVAVAGDGNVGATKTLPPGVGVSRGRAARLGDSTTARNANMQHATMPTPPIISLPSKPESHLRRTLFIILIVASTLWLIPVWRNEQTCEFAD
jgi:hypothetical protein